MPSRSSTSLRDRLGGWTYVLVACAVVVVAEVVGRVLSLSEVVVIEDDRGPSRARADRPATAAGTR